MLNSLSFQVMWAMAESIEYCFAFSSSAKSILPAGTREMVNFF